LDTEDAFIIYPNPGNQTLNVQTGLNSTGTIEIIDMTGRQIDIKHIHKGDNKITFATENLKPGMYYIRFTSDEVNETQKWIKK
jgi:hypothetical protein